MNLPCTFFEDTPAHGQPIYYCFGNVNHFNTEAEDKFFVGRWDDMLYAIEDIGGLKTILSSNDQQATWYPWEPLEPKETILW